ncbi:MAG TPA: peroxidase-related enzyme [Planctomycetota bacterium]|nr:peroxidase-related enzyme [Planctomycetota bacterium]
MEDDERDRWVEAVARDWRSADLSEVDAALCAYAEKLTREPRAMGEADIEGLRRVGLSDEAIHDAVQVVAYFNYINRVADALNVDLEPEMPPR